MEYQFILTDSSKKTKIPPKSLNLEKLTVNNLIIIYILIIGYLILVFYKI